MPVDLPHIYATPSIDRDDEAVVDAIRSMRASLADDLRVPRRWQGGLRRTTQARAIQGSNTIEGYTVSDQDAVAAIDDDEPLDADARTWAEILGYRRMMTYVLRTAPEADFVPDSRTLRAMHFMLLEHDLGADPGRFRPGAVYVRDEAAGRTVYEGPSSALVPALVDELVTSLPPLRQGAARTGDAIIAAAMAHLNLVMIHPFRDGNGRMARALQTLVLARDHVLEPTFSSIEEWLGHNTDDYYRVLAATGQGGWHPERDATLWVRFCLRAHHMQAQTLRRRVDEAVAVWGALDELTTARSLPERSADAMFDAVLGLRVTRPAYARRADVEAQTATRDLRRLVDAGFLEPHGNTRGRYYLAGPPLRAVRAEARAGRAPLADPYPWLPAELARRAAR